MNISQARRILSVLTILSFVLVSSVGFSTSQRVRAGTVCSPATAITVPYSKDGTGDVCLQATSLCTYINSWGLTTLEVNGTAYTNTYTFSSSIAPLNGGYTIHYVSTSTNGHFEISSTPCNPAGPTPTNTAAGPTATFTRTLTPTRTNTPGLPTATSTITKTPTKTPTRTATSPASGGTVNTYGRLQISGTTLKDKNGNPVQLAGISSHGLTWFPLSDLNLNTTGNMGLLNQQINFNPAGGVPFPYTSSAVTNLVSQWHIEVTRASMFSYDPWNIPYGTARSYDNYYPNWKWYNINLVNSIVQSAINNNIYVIIDWHAGEGNDPDPNVYWSKNEVQEFFTYMVDKWGSYPNVIYETVNSPVLGWADNGSQPGLKTYNQNVINLIRSRESTDGYAPNMILAGTPTWSQDVDVAANDPLTGSMIAYNFMWYAGTHGASYRTKAENALATLATKASNQTLFMGEVGTTQSNGSGGVYYSEFNTWMEWAKTKNLSWLNWSISNKDETSALFVPAVYGTTQVNIANNETAWRGGDSALGVAQAMASTGYPMRMGPWADADYTCSGKFIKAWILNNTSQSVPSGC